MCFKPVRFMFDREGVDMALLTLHTRLHKW